MLLSSGARLGEIRHDFQRGFSPAKKAALVSRIFSVGKRPRVEKRNKQGNAKKRRPRMRGIGA